MQFKKSLICGAVLMTFTAASNAAYEMPSLPSNFDETLQQTDETNQHTDIIDLEKGKVGIVKPMENGSAGGSPSFIFSNTSNDVRTNHGTIWSVAGNLGDDGVYGNYVSAMYAGNGGTVENYDTIYVKSNAKYSSGGLNAESAKAMSADQNGTIANHGTIIVENATGIALNTKAEGQKIVNEGTIVVQDGYGMSVNINDSTGDATSVSLANNGTISVESGVGVQLNKSFNNGTFTNRGTINGEGISINAITTENLNLELTEASHITGDILLSNTATVNAQKLANDETIKLNTAGTVNVTEGSNLTITNVQNEYFKDATIAIGTVNTDEGSSTTFLFDHVGNGTKLVNVDKVTGEGDVNVNYTGDVSDALANNQASLDDLIDDIQLGENNEGLKTVIVDEGKWGNGLVMDKAGNVLSTTTNSLLSSTTDLALMNGLVWRSQLTNLSDRMGTLRTMPQAAGAWARYNNGRLDGRGIEYDYNTIEVGFDAPVSSNFLVGVSFDYTIGDTDLNAGSADNDVYTLGLYGTYFGDNGGFVDLMAKIGRIDNEYDISNKSGVENGDYMMTGAIVGIEAGHRFDLAHNTFVEPQVQLSYSWLRASDYSTNVRSVDFETIESLVARVGVMGGIKFNENRGAAYLKASYNHDFLGDVDAEYSALDGSMSHPFKISDELDDNWAEVSLGFSYNVTDSFNTFLDVGTGFGGDIDQKWRVNFGGRYTF